MILELQIKYLREMEAFYCDYIYNENIYFTPVGLCNRSYIAGGKKFEILFIKEAEKYCIDNKIERFYYKIFYWFPIDSEGLRTRKNIVRAIRKRKEALLKECIY